MTSNIDIADIDKAKKQLGKAVNDFVMIITDLSEALKNCRGAGLDINDMHSVIMESVPEADRPAFQQQWPMLSMLLSAL